MSNEPPKPVIKDGGTPFLAKKLARDKQVCYWIDAG
jgi:hypothetical protein